ncbi:mdm2-binding protein isoform X2 [Esox lucius]|uniref:mdm2-binding protein isoform X2 n=1 Tax=Esox lucius TaxID=8010 RepID=UPI001476FEA9|nr:mdm2-binding protein isoform X2 [Esox lucius]
MDRYVLVISFNQEVDKCTKALEYIKQIYCELENITSCNVNSTRKISLFPACSLSGGPASQRWYFAVQACHGTYQFCSAEWEEVGDCQENDSEEESLNSIEAFLSALDDQEERADPQQHTELYEEAAEGLHLLSDKLPPPGKALLDVIFLGGAEEAPNMKEFLPVIGSLKHMQAWHSAKVTMVTDHHTGWKKPASYLSARVIDPSVLETCIDERELWRGGILIREKKFASEVRFEGFSLRAPEREARGSLTPLDAGGSRSNSDHMLHSEVFHYYQPVLDLVQLVTVSDLPSFLRSSTEFCLGLSFKSMKAKLLLDQFKPLSGKVGALFSLSCTVSGMALPPASQLGSQKWKDFVAQRPKGLPVPDVEVKGESGHYFLLVQGSGGEDCKARMIHSASQINGAAAMATVNGLLKEKALSSSGSDATDWLRSLPCLHGDQLLQRERKMTKVQTLVLKECLRRQVEAEKPASIPVNDLKVLLSLAREQYLRMHDSDLPTTSTLPHHATVAPGRGGAEKENAAVKQNATVKPTEFRKDSQHSGWPERSALQNYENLRRSRQRMRFGLLSGSSSDCLLGPKDIQGQRTTPALLDAKEFLRHFTPDGHPSGDLQPLLVQRLGGNAFQMSPDLTPRKVTKLPFNQAASSHYHGLEFCLDEQGHKALDRDRSFVKLQSRVIRYETQTTCSKDPCPIPFALSPAPSPAVLSEPGSVPDGEALLNSDLPRIKRRSWDTEAIHPHKRLAKSVSSESLGSASSGIHPAVRALRRQPSRTQSASSVTAPRPPPPEHHQPPPRGDRPTPGQGKEEDKANKESRSQKHARMLKDVVARTLKHQGITSQHECFAACSQRLFEISKFYLKDLKTSRGLHEEMKKAASSNVKQVIDWVTEKAAKK